MFNVLGIFLIVAGMASIAVPLVAGGAAVLMVGCFMVASGLFQVSHAFSNISWGQRFAWMLVGALSTLGGALVLAHPLFGLSFVTLAVAAYFVSAGIVKLGAAAAAAGVPGRAATAISGLLSLLLGGLLWSEWPLSGVWAIGTLVGIELIMSGAVMMTSAGPLSQAV